MRRDILAAIEDRVLVCEGAMGSQLAARGVTVRCSAEANLTHPEIVSTIHRSYREAGAQVFQTNTFAANPYMLARAGLADSAASIWATAVRLCREAAGPEAYVAANGGPTGHLLAPLGELSEEDVRSATRRQFEVMLGCEVDLVLLEGFETVEEARAAVRGIRDLDSNIPVAVTLAFSSLSGRTSMGVDGATAASCLGDLNVQIIGAGCGTPAALEKAIRQMGECCSLPLIAQPNAGVPELVGGETVFDMSPRAAGQLAARLIGYGVRLVGSCCGSTPDHTRQIARAAAAAV